MEQLSIKEIKMASSHLRLFFYTKLYYQHCLIFARERGQCWQYDHPDKLEFVELSDLGNRQFYRRLKIEKAAPCSCNG